MPQYCRFPPDFPALSFHIDEAPTPPRGRRYTAVFVIYVYNAYCLAILRIYAYTQRDKKRTRVYKIL